VAHERGTHSYTAELYYDKGNVGIHGQEETIQWHMREAKHHTLSYTALLYYNIGNAGIHGQEETIQWHIRQALTNVRGAVWINTHQLA
jgi:hypothetical protein